MVHSLIQNRERKSNPMGPRAFTTPKKKKEKNPYKCCLLSDGHAPLAMRKGTEFRKKEVSFPLARKGICGKDKFRNHARRSRVRSVSSSATPKNLKILIRLLTEE